MTVLQKINFLKDVSCADSGRALPCTRKPFKKGLILNLVP